mmetsp:Transcript_28753/g.41166  ORF Transcript_28753/g.41166 Transcript_28753/m.41166 type:complete len:109 (-) Transcript_28753:2133-2459(-)
MVNGDIITRICVILLYSVSLICMHLQKTQTQNNLHNYEVLQIKTKNIECNKLTSDRLEIELRNLQKVHLSLQCAKSTHLLASTLRVYCPGDDIALVASISLIQLEWFP